MIPCVSISSSARIYATARGWTIYGSPVARICPLCALSASSYASLMASRLFLSVMYVLTLSISFWYSAASSPAKSFFSCCFLHIHPDESELCQSRGRRICMYRLFIQVLIEDCRFGINVLADRSAYILLLRHCLRSVFFDIFIHNILSLAHMPSVYRR